MKSLKNQSGSILLLVLVVAPIAAILFFSLISTSLVSRRQSVISRNVVGYSALLDATLDYTAYAVRNHWCMTPQWQRDISAVCGMTHPMNLERMILDPQAIKSYFDFTGATSNVVLSKITGTVPIHTIPSTHPLFKVIENMKTSGGAVAIDAVDVTVERIDNANVPRRGRESYLQITASLVTATSMPFFRNFTALKAISRVMVTPRELNYFSLIVPHDLRLDGSPAGSGDFSVPVTGGAGLSFESPVYVNGDIYVPLSATGSYTPATFSSKVVLGGSTAAGTGGRLMQGGAPLAPPSGGSADSIYSNMEGFGGFKRGIDMDGVPDKGLDVFAGNDTMAVTALAAQMECVELNRVKSDLTLTKNTDLAIRPMSYTSSRGVDTAPDDYLFHIGLTEGNMFNHQDVKPYKRGTPPPNSKLGPVPLAGKSVAQVVITIGNGTPTAAVPNGREAKFVMGDGASATPSGNSAELKLRNFASPGVDDPSITVTLTPFKIGGVDQPHIREMHVIANGRKDQIGPVKITVTAFDVGTWAGRDRRVPEAVPPATPIPDFTLAQDHSLEGAIHFKTNSNTMVQVNKDITLPPMVLGGPYVKMDETNRKVGPPVGQTDNPLDPPGPNEAYDYATVIKKCTTSSAAAAASTAGSAFGNADWNKDFYQETRHTWHFAPEVSVQPTTNPHPIASWFSLFFEKATPSGFVIPNTAPPTVVPPAPPSTKSPFLVKSIVGECIIPATTTFVAAFMVCDRMTIQARTQPLMMYGTYIFKQFDIDPSAVAAGITFRSIFHPQATADLRKARILHDNFGNPCPATASPTAHPIWWPELNPREYTRMRNCSVVSLRDQANPFTWTTMNPDCGMVGANMSCKHHPTNFLLTEISRESDLQ